MGVSHIDMTAEEIGEVLAKWHDGIVSMVTCASCPRFLKIVPTDVLRDRDGTWRIRNGNRFEILPVPANYGWAELEITDGPGKPKRGERLCPDCLTRVNIRPKEIPEATVPQVHAGIRPVVPPPTTPAPVPVPATPVHTNPDDIPF